MTYAYKRVTVSGINIGTEGTSKAISLITDFLVNDCGWILEDDRRSQGGSATLSATHKVVLRNNKGENGDTPEWYITLASGVGAAAANSNIDCFIHTAYDVGTHTVPASGLSTPLQTVRNGVTFVVDTDGYFNMWMFGDKDGFVVVNNELNTQQMLIAGRVYPLLSDTYEPYGIYLTTQSNSFSPLHTSIRSIIGQPPLAITTASEGSFLWHAPTATQEPRLGLPSNREPTFALLPILFVASNATNKGAIGIVRHVFGAVPESVGWVEGSILTASGSGRTYIAFTEGTATSVFRTV